MPLFEEKEVALPDGQTATVRELSVGQLNDADRKGTEAVVSLMKLLPEKIVENQLARQRETTMERIIRYEGYDPEALIMHGLISWSYDEPCDEEHKAQLGGLKGEVIARAVFEISVVEAGEVVRSDLRLAEVESQDGSTEPTTSIPQTE